MQQRFFEKHLASWIGRFFADLERAEAAEFYRHVGALGRLFLETETEAFTLPTWAEARSQEDDVMRYGRQDLTRTSSVPSCAWRRSGGRRRVAARSGGESR